MIVILSRFGQLGNRMMLFSKFITLALEEDLEIMNPAFVEYADLFEFFTQNRLGAIPAGNVFWGKTPARASFVHELMKIAAFVVERLPFLRAHYGVLRAGSGKKFNLAAPDFVKMSRSKTMFFLEGWPRLQVSYKAKYADQLRTYFRPHRKHQERIDSVVNQARKLGDVLVGIHIRHGDYRTWEDGKYFFPAEEYARVTEGLAELFPGMQVAFLIVSDEQQSAKVFEGQSFLFGDGNAIEDMYSLAACDYIVGPPSTFSGWASFYGRTPRYILKNSKGPISLEDFITPAA